MEIFEGDLKGAGYPRNGNACQGEIPVLAPTQRLLLQAQPRRGGEERGTQWQSEASASDIREVEWKKGMEQAPGSE